MTFKNPQMKLNGHYLPQQEVNIKVTAGAYFDTFALIVPNNIDDNLKDSGLQNGDITLDIVTYNIQDGTEKEVISSFKKLWLLRREKVSAYMVAYILADNRFSLKGKLLNFSYNITLVKNQLGNIDLKMNTPADLKTDFDLFKKGRYATWSVKKDTRDPYTMLEILELELNRLGVAIIKNKTPLDSYIMENIEVNNQDVYTALSMLLQQARLNMSILNTGEIYIYSIDKEVNESLFTLLTLQVTQNITPSIIFRSDNSRIRPKKVVLRYERLEECFCVYEKKNYSAGEDQTSSISSNMVDRTRRTYIPPKVINGKALWTDDAFYKMRIIGVENVMPLPRPENFGGIEYLAGEWFPIQKYLFYLGFSDRDIRENWFADRLVFIIYMRLLKLYSNPTRETLHSQASYIASTIKAHYLQTFMIDPFVMPFIKRITTKDINIIDNYSGFSSVSPVYTDYTIVPHLRNPRIAKRLENWNTSVVNWNVNEKDPYRTKATASYIQMLSPELGVFAIKFQPTIFSTLQDLIPFKLKVNPNRGLGHNINNLIAIPSMLDKCSIDENYEMLAKVGIVWKAKVKENQDMEALNPYNSEDKYYSITIDEKVLKAEGNSVFKIDPSDFARMSMRRYNDDGSLYTEEDTLLNETIIKSLAKGYNDRIMQQYRDFLKGRLTLAGYIEVPFFGNIGSATYNFSSKNGTNTTYEALPYIPYSIEHTVDQSTINYLYKHLLDSQLND